MLIDIFTQEQIETEVVLLSSEDKTALRKGWRFNWLKEMKARQVYKLVSKGKPSMIHGLVSFEERNGYLLMALVERAGSAKSEKRYEGVLQTLAAFVCQKSMERGYEGAVAFDSKTALVEHYEKTLGATRIGNSSRMVIETEVAAKLIEEWL